VRAAPHALLARGVASGQGELVLDLELEQPSDAASKLELAGGPPR
jgi:hypothetical protein